MAPDHREILLDVTELTVHFNTDRGEVKALDRVELSVAQGEIVGLIGESGSGKTTIARSIFRVLPPAGKVIGGSIRFARQHLLTMSEAQLNRRRAGQRHYPDTPGPLQFLKPGIQGRHPDQRHHEVEGKRRAKVPASMRKKSLPCWKKFRFPPRRINSRKYPHQFSGGQRQRLMIAMALLPGPEMVIADEPTTALDVTVEAQILKLIRDWSRKGVYRCFSLRMTWEWPVRSAKESWSCMPDRKWRMHRRMSFFPIQAIPIPENFLKAFPIRKATSGIYRERSRSGQSASGVSFPSKVFTDNGQLFAPRARQNGSRRQPLGTLFPPD